MATPNFLSAIVGGYESGSRMAERNRLAELDSRGRELAGQAMGGDKNALSELYRVDPDRGMQVQKFTREEAAARLDELASGAMAADTPAKWEAFKQRSAAQGHVLDPGDTRESILDQAMGWKEKLAQQNNDRNYKADRSDSDRSYSLQRDQFGETKRYHDDQLALERDKLNQPETTSDLKEYNFAVSQGFKGSYVDFKNALKSGTQLEVGPDGSVSFTQGMGKPLTEGQSKDTVYLNRMINALPTIEKMGGNLLNLGENVGGQLPIAGNYLKSSEYQQAEQAASEWVQSFLRKDSGATITPAEKAETVKIYIPQPGDKPEVLAQKQKARRNAALGVKMGLPPQAIKQFELQGVDLEKMLSPQADTGNKGDQGGKPRVRTYNPATDELE